MLERGVATGIADARAPEGTSPPARPLGAAGAVGTAATDGAPVGRAPMPANAEEMAKEATGGMAVIGATDAPGREAARGAETGGAASRGGATTGGA